MMSQLFLATSGVSGSERSEATSQEGALFATLRRFAPHTLQFLYTLSPRVVALALARDVRVRFIGAEAALLSLPLEGVVHEAAAAAVVAPVAVHNHLLGEGHRGVEERPVADGVGALDRADGREGPATTALYGVCVWVYGCMGVCRGKLEGGLALLVAGLLT